MNIKNIKYGILNLNDDIIDRGKFCKSNQMEDAILDKIAADKESTLIYRKKQPKHKLKTIINLNEYRNEILKKIKFL